MMKRLNFSAVVVLGAAIAVVGCAKKDSAKPATTVGKSIPKGEESKEHAHGAGPNGGVLFDLGSYHAEFTVEHGKHEATVLIIGTDEKTPAMIDAKEFVLNTKTTKTAEGKEVAPMTVTMTPVNVADGKASKYVGSDPGIGNVADFAGTVSGEIEGKPAMGEFAE